MDFQDGGVPILEHIPIVILKLAQENLEKNSR